jgi:dihydroorotase
MTAMRSLLLRNVRSIGFVGPDLKEGMDLSIDQAGTVDRLGFDLPDTGYDTILDLERSYLSPGWIDLHTHVYEGGTHCAVNPDEIGAKAGVTVLVDAGSAGHANFSGFRDFVIKKYENTQIISFINVGNIGLVLGDRVSEFARLDQINPDALFDCIQENREHIRGVKVRASGDVFRGWESEAVRLASKAAREVDLPLMVHVADPLPLLEDILPILRSGDIVTHCYHGRRWGLLDKERIIPQAIQARERGVLFDVGHGYGSFDVHVAEKALSLGFKPDTISSDLHVKSKKRLCYSLALTMSKFLSLGLSLEEVIRDVTANPARIVKVDGFTSGIVGKKARFTVFSTVNEPLDVMDNYGNGWIINSLIQPRYTIAGNRLIKATAMIAASEGTADVLIPVRKD